MNTPYIVFGASGLLGRELSKQLRDKDHPIVQINTDNVDISSVDQVKSLFKLYAFKEEPIIINAAAMTNTKLCQEWPNRCYAVNTLGVLNILNNISNKQLFIQLSTNYVFDGLKEEPYTIYDAPNPINTYGYSKYLAEETIKSIHKNYSIVRTSMLFGKGRNNIVTNIVDKILKKEPIYTNSIYQFNITYTKDLADWIIHSYHPIISHVANYGRCNHAALCTEIVSILNKPVDLIYADNSEEEDIRRPLQSQIIVNNGYKLLRSWQEAVKDFIETEY